MEIDQRLVCRDDLPDAYAIGVILSDIEPKMTNELPITKNRVVRFHYTIRDSQNQILETSRNDEPLAILHGHGNVLSGIESALDGHVGGDSFSVTLPPEETYGVRRHDWTQRVSKKHLPKQRLKPGMTVNLSTEQGPRLVTVVKVGNKVADVDLNHPFVGQTLTFEIEVLEVREAVAEELAHGHVHGPGGHQH